MLDHPAYVSGTHRDELALHRAIPGLVAKAGAEAVYAVGLPDGRGIATQDQRRLRRAAVPSRWPASSGGSDSTIRP